MSSYTSGDTFTPRAEVQEMLQSLVDKIHDDDYDVQAVQAILASNVQRNFSLGQMRRLAQVIVEHLFEVIVCA